jgi:hypothetical protein
MKMKETGSGEADFLALYSGYTGAKLKRVEIAR